MMTWPTDDLNTDALDSPNDMPPRVEFFKIFQQVKAMIAARGQPNGIASLDSSGKVPAAQIDSPTTGLIGQPNGIASLDGAGKVPRSQLSIDTIPLGTIVATAGAVRPDGWLFCNGSTVSRTTYRELFNAIGTAYGRGDGNTTFNLPFMQSRFPLGASTTHQRGTRGGEIEHQLTIAEMPAHSHAYFGAISDTNFAGARQTRSGARIGPTQTNFEGSSIPHNNMPPYVSFNYLIKVR